MPSLLMIFVKNPRPGQVKTRLAKTVGHEKAMEIYQQLLRYTHQTVSPLSSHKAIFYNEFIDHTDVWDSNIYQKHLQQGSELGEKMHAAFSRAFENTYQKVLIIGSDCPELSTELLEKAFEALENHDVIFGPAEDGGYYLLGMRKLIPELFLNKQWSTDHVLKDSLRDCQELDLSYVLLPTLSDIDYEQDWLRFKEKLAPY